MAKKADLLEKAQSLGLKVSMKNTIAELEAAIDGIGKSEQPTVDSPVKTENEVETASVDQEEAPKLAKAGKRSAKAIKEAKAADEKEERKVKVAAGEIDPAAEGIKKGPTPITRPKIERRSKAYRAAAEKIKTDKQHPLKEGLQLAVDSSTVKFDATVELHVRLNVDPRQADQNIRDSIVLPHGTGKSVRVAVFAPTDQHDAAKKAGADIVGEADFLDQLKKEEINFDVLVATPDVMAQLGQYARLLGPKGLMPNPKSGTVTKDVAKAVKEAKAGRVEYRVDPQGIIHLAVGKVSFGADKLHDNADTVLQAIKSAKPSSIKGTFVETISVSSTMGPGIKITF